MDEETVVQKTIVYWTFFNKEEPGSKAAKEWIKGYKELYSDETV